MSPSEKRITYATLASSSDEVHQGFDDGIARVRDTLGQTYPMWIGGSPIRVEATFDNVSPSDRDCLVGRFQEGKAAHADAAVDAAWDAFDGWSSVDWRERIAVLRRAAELIKSRRYELSALMSFEAGKSRLESLGDTEEAADLILYYAQVMEEADGFERPMGQLTPNERTRDLLRPYGVWVAISPFNFPLALGAGMCAGILLGGNTLVYKPSPDAPATAAKLVELLHEAGVPKGAVNLVTDSGVEVGKALVANQRVSGLVFTGSKDVGFTIYRNFSEKRPRPCILELGGKNPAIVTDRADIDKAAEGVMRGAFGLTGQKCSATSRAYVHRDVMGAFEEALLEKTAEMKIGNPLERDVFMGPLINERAYRNYARYVDEVREAGGTIRYGGGVLNDGEFSKGYFVEPTIATELPRDHRLLLEELFVPLVTLTEIESLDDGIEQANRVEYGLTAGIFSEEPTEIERFFDRIQAGVTHANRRSGATTGAWPGVNPFCGWKASGSTGKGVCGPYYVTQFMREQSRTVLE